MWFELILTFLALSVIALAISWYKFGTATTLRLPPGPRGLPVVGYLPFLGPNLHHEFTKMAHRYGPIFKLKLGSKTYIVVSSSDLAKTVVRELDDIFANRDPPVAGLVASYGGHDIVWSDNNSYWRNLRKVLATEVLSNKNLEASRPFRQTGARETIKSVYEKMGTEVDIGRVAFFTSLSVVTSMLWGKSLVDGGKNSNLGVEFRDVIRRMVDLLGVPNVSDFFPVLARFDLQGVERAMKRQQKHVDLIFESIIEQRIKSNATKTDESVEQQGRKDLLQILLELKDQNTTSSLNITHIKALLMDIILGGTDTISTMVEWTMTEILHNPMIMKKVQDELEEIVGLNNVVEEHHLSKLEYLDAVIKETFRVHSALPLLVARCPNQPCNVGGFTVPKGSVVFLNVWAMHRDPQHWENPSVFNPNRFLNHDGTTKFDYTGYNCNYIPFGSGRRRCPGVPLTEKLLIYYLASLLHPFEWMLPNNQELDLSEKFGIVLKKRKPLVAIPSQRLRDKNLYM